MRATPNKSLIVILGPTASGKTAVSIELSRLAGCEIISADSRQIYKYLDIGTAKPSQVELNTVPHHFIDIIYPDENYSAGRFGMEAEKTVEEIIQKKKIPLLVGGSGLYIRALCEGFFKEFNTKERYEIRKKLTEGYDEQSKKSLYKLLLGIDPASADLYKDMNPRRVLRALEFFYSTGVPLSKAQKDSADRRDFKAIYFGIEIERDRLYSIIDKRAEAMWKGGLIKETKEILDFGFDPEINSLNTVGYKECIAYLKRKMSASEALEKMKQNTRRYAKRQMTWFRKNKEITWLHGYPEEIAKYILDFIISHRLFSYI